MAASRTPGRPPGRRRQRSVRVTVAVVLLGVATAAVLLSLPTQSPALLSVSAVAAVVLGWAALRIVWTEVLQSRRENAADRAATASAYRSLFTERAAEHAEFTTAMTERLAASNLSVHELEGALVQSQRLAASEKIRADAAEERIEELQRSIEVLRAEQEQAVVADVEPGSLDDLAAFDEKVAKAVADSHATKEAPAKLA